MSDNGGKDYEYLVVETTVDNKTQWDMILTGFNLEWGKWDNSPVDVGANSKIGFTCRGRAGSPSGVQGWVTWGIKGHPAEPQPEIRYDFDNPAVGGDNVSVKIEPKDARLPTVQINQTGGNDDKVTITVG